MSLEQCPKCDRKLNPPLQSSGRQVCMKCGWSDQPRQAATHQKTAPTDLNLNDIKQLLNQATAESLENMNPKNRKAQAMINQLKNDPSNSGA